jgi:hypothetical protein
MGELNDVGIAGVAPNINARNTHTPEGRGQCPQSPEERPIDNPNIEVKGAFSLISAALAAASASELPSAG